MNYKPDVLALTEHWLKPGEHLVVDGYRLAFCFSRVDGIHGGSGILVKSELKCQELEVLKQKSIEKVIECSAIKLIELKMVIINIYRPPNGEIDDFLLRLEVILEEINDRMNMIIVTGDFNIDISKNDNRAKNLLDTFKRFNLHHQIKEPTRIAKSTKTVIDNIFTNINNCETEVLLSALSDHLAQRMTMVIEKGCAKIPRIEKRFFHQDRLDVMKCELGGMDWFDVISSDDVNCSYSNFIRILTLSIERNTYKKIVSVGNSPKDVWMTDHIKRLCGIKRQMYEAVLQNNLDKDIYRNFCSNLKKEIEHSRRKTYANYITNSSNPIKKTWEIINQIQGKMNNKHFEIDALQTKGKTNIQTLTDMNEYFINTVDNQVTRPCVRNNKKLIATFALYLTNHQEVVNTIKDLNNTTATGIDEVPVSVLKHCAEELAPPLVHIINTSFQRGIFPDDLKHIIIRPIYKKGEKSKFENYRPIALISNISKIFEKIVLARMVTFLDKNKLLNTNQNGYIRGRSTTRALFQFLMEILDGINKQESVICTLLDLSRAFDSVHHGVLLEKLESLGFRGVVLEWIASYLTDRKQCVATFDSTGKEIRSEWCKVSLGVPQGSILGPMLFLLYVNDLPDIVDGLIVMYADDTSIVTRAADEGATTNKLKVNLEEMEGWFSQNNLKLNINKTNFIKFTNNENTWQTSYHGNILTGAENASFLGWSIDSHLSWRQHVDFLANKLNSSCYALRMVARNVGVSAAVTVYYSNVYSRLKYGIIFWGNSVDSRRLFVLQKACIRSVFGASARDSCVNIFKTNNILTLPSMFVLECALFVKQNYDEFFKKYELSHGHDTRGNNHNFLLQPQTHLTKIQKNVLHQCIKIYNYLPVNIRELSHKQFKVTLRNILVKQTLYTVDDFFRESIQF